MLDNNQINKCDKNYKRTGYALVHASKKPDHSFIGILRDQVRSILHAGAKIVARVWTTIGIDDFSTLWGTAFSCAAAS